MATHNSCSTIEQGRQHGAFKKKLTPNVRIKEQSDVDRGLESNAAFLKLVDSCLCIAKIAMLHSISKLTTAYA